MKKSKKALCRVTALALVFALMMPLTLQSGAKDFTDITQSETKVAVGVLSDMGIIGGYPDGTFRPYGNLTRSQFAKIIISALGRENMLLQYKNYTIFPDVPSTYWAAGYVNYCAQGLGLIRGNPDGTFRPEDSVTYAQAITICLRTLGYTENDLGGLWPRDYIAKAEEIGLSNGIAVSPNAPMNRGDGAVLVRNMLITETVTQGAATGKRFIETLGNTIVSDVILVSTGSSNSAIGPLEIIAGDTTFKTMSGISTSLIGRKGDLVKNKDGFVTSFVPRYQKAVSIVISDAQQNVLKATDGTQFRLSPETKVINHNAIKLYKNIYSSALFSGISLTLYYDGNGDIDYISTAAAVAQRGPYILSSGFSYGSNPLAAFAPAANFATAKIIKNGAEASLAELAYLDVAYYDSGTNTFYVVDRKLTGSCDAIKPSRVSPEAVEVFGQSFLLSSGAKAKFSEVSGAFKAGDVVTLLFGLDGAVVGAVSQSVHSADNYALVDSASSSTVSFSLIDGTQVADYPAAADYSALTGTLVTVRPGTGGKVYLSEVAFSETLGTLDTVSGVFGNYPISPSAAIFEQVDGKIVRKIKLSDIAQARIPGQRALLARVSGGKISTLILPNITGDAYAYGVLSGVTGEEGVGYTYSIKTPDGALNFAVAPIYHSGTSNPYIGILASGGTGYNVVGLTRLFTGTDVTFANGYATFSGKTVRMADTEMMAYLQQSGRFIPLTEAQRDYRLSLYSDRALADGGKIRLIVAN